MSAPVRLPTASPQRVKQPRYRARELAVETATQAGKLVAFPGQFMFAADRQAQAERDAALAVYEAGGLTRSPVFLMASAILGALSPAQQARAMAVLQIIGADCGPEAAAALLWSRRLVADMATIRAAGDSERQGWGE